MDPYLEGDLWPDVHHRLASEIARQLAPLLVPRYVARIERSVIRDRTPEVELGIMYPDVGVLEQGQPARKSPRSIREGGVALAPELALAAPPKLPRIPPMDIRVARVVIRDTAHNRLVTLIEIMSPVNKRGPGLEQHRRKRERLIEAGVHVLEIDLIRRGTRVIEDPRMPETAYLITLTRGGSDVIEVWPIGLRDRLPDVPVPLLLPDPYEPLDPASALDAIYDEAVYGLSIDYHREPPPPPLSESDRVWVDERVAAGG